MRQRLALRRGEVAAVMALFAVLAAPAGARGAERSANLFSATPESRYLDGAALDDPQEAETVMRSVARVPVRVTASTTACAQDSRWTLGAHPLRPHIQGCAFRIALVPRPASYTLTVRAGTRVQTLTLPIHDRLIVAVGDSVASGEGNPGHAPSWASPRCHRSPVAGDEQAARILGSDPVAGRSVTFVSFACSGATIAHGLLGPYDGIEHPRGAQMIPAQVDQVQRLAATARRRPDAVVVTIGANDVFFGDVVRLCIAKPACPSQRLDPDHHGDSLSADERVGTALARLGPSYDTLAARLRPIVRTPARIVITDYFDPTRDRRGATCHAIVDGAVSRAELEWAETSVLMPLNDEVAAAAHRHGWSFAGGIASAFATHGYCTPPAERWVRRVGESLANLSGPLHPNAAGHRAIAAAIVPVLGPAVGLSGSAGPAGVQPDGGVNTRLLAAIVAAAIVLVALALWRSSTFRCWLTRLATRARHLGKPALIALGWWRRSAIRRWSTRFATRVRHLARPGHGRPSPTKYGKPQFPALAEGPSDTALVNLLIKAGGALATAAVSVGFVAAVGAAIVWVRFWAARYPADQAVDAVSRDELLVIGAQALVLFALAGFAAVGVMWLLDPKGTPGRRMTVALAVLVFAELAAAVVLGGFATRQLVVLVAGFAVAALLGFFVFEVLRRQVSARRSQQGAGSDKVVGYLARRYFPDADVGRPRNWGLRLVTGLVLIGVATAIVLTATDVEHAHAGWWLLIPGLLLAGLLIYVWPRLILPLLALGSLAAAVAGATRFEHGDTRIALVFGAIVLAYVLFAVPRPVPPGSTAVHEDAATSPELRAARAALAATSFVSLALFLARDELWLGLAALAAVVLAGLCLAVAWASDKRFVPFALTVFFSVCVFGAVLACLRTIDSPQAQPVALLLKDNRSVCGVWVGESSGRIWYARLRLSELAVVRRPVPRDSALTSVKRDDIDDMALGPLQPVGRAQDQAAALRSALVAEHTGGQAPATGCGPLRRRHQSVPHTPERRLAKAVQPELVVDRHDGFWPVSVLTLLRMQDRRARVCRRVADGTCVRLTTQSDLSFNGGEGEWLDYPPNPLHRDEEQRAFTDALGSVDPTRTAREYFLVSHAPRPDAPITVQFWFFYTYNYLQTGGVLRHDAGLHEGDFETVSVLLSAHSHEPRYVWMARHKDEGRMFLWDEEQLTKSAGHLVAYAARGSHADYESCRRQSRAIQAPAGLIDDRPQCDVKQELHLAPESTHLIDLSRVPWACWRGRFGEQPGGRFLDHVPYESDAGPLGPLWQQAFGGVPFEPCRGVRVSTSRDVDPKGAPGEEVLTDAVSQRLRAQAGVLDPAVDECSDWEHPPSAGAFLVACDQDELTRYLTSGLERPSATGLRIDVAGGAARPGPMTVPAIRRDPREPSIDRWRVTAIRPTSADIYVACQAHDGYLEARFPAVAIAASASLRVDARDRSTWRLRDEAGTAVAQTTPRVIKPPGDGRPVACAT